jgi:hypothetical protein
MIIKSFAEIQDHAKNNSEYYDALTQEWAALPLLTRLFKWIFSRFEILNIQSSAQECLNKTFTNLTSLSQEELKKHINLTEEVLKGIEAASPFAKFASTIAKVVSVAALLQQQQALENANINNLQQRLKEAEKLLKEKETLIAQSQHQERELNTQIQQHVQSIADYQKQVETLRNAIQQKEKIMAETLSKNGAQSGALNSEVENLKKEKKAVEIQIREQQIQLNSTKKSHEEALSKQEEEIKQLQQQRFEQNNYIETLKQELAAAKSTQLKQPAPPQAPLSSSVSPQPDAAPVPTPAPTAVPTTPHVANQPSLNLNTDEIAKTQAESKEKLEKNAAEALREIEKQYTIHGNLRNARVILIGHSLWDSHGGASEKADVLYATARDAAKNLSLHQVVDETLYVVRPLATAFESSQKEKVNDKLWEIQTPTFYSSAITECRGFETYIAKLGELRSIITRLASALAQYYAKQNITDQAKTLSRAGLLLTVQELLCSKGKKSAQNHEAPELTALRKEYTECNSCLKKAQKELETVYANTFFNVIQTTLLSGNISYANNVKTSVTNFLNGSLGKNNEKGAFLVPATTIPILRTKLTALGIPSAYLEPKATNRTVEDQVMRDIIEEIQQKIFQKISNRSYLNKDGLVA